MFLSRHQEVLFQSVGGKPLVQSKGGSAGRGPLVLLKKQTRSWTQGTPSTPQRSIIWSLDDSHAALKTHGSHSLAISCILLMCNMFFFCFFYTIVANLFRSLKTTLLFQFSVFIIWNIYKQRVWPQVSVTLSSKGRLGADCARVPWPRHMLSQAWLITEQTLSVEGSLGPESLKTTLQTDNSTRLTTCQEGLAPGPRKFTLTTPYPGNTSHNLPKQAVTYTCHG